MERPDRIQAILEYLNTTNINTNISVYMDEKLGFPYTNVREHRLTIEEMESHFLIEMVGKDKYWITYHGEQVLNNGGYRKFLERLENEKQRDEKIQEYTLKQLKGNIFNIRFWWIPLAISIIAGFITGNFDTIKEWLQAIIK
jgi:hypothetical protein